MTFSTVVAGLDFGPRTQAVAAFSHALASQLGARLVHLHAEDVSPLAPEWAELAQEADRLRREAADQHANGSAEIAWRPGPPAAALQDEAQTRKAGFVVVGTGATGTTPDLGRNTTHMLRSVTVPVCLVPTHEGAQTTLTGGNILAPVDFSHESNQALVFVRELALRLGVKVSLVTVVRPPGLVAHLGANGGAQLPALLQARMDHALDDLRKDAAAAGLEHASLHVVEGDDVALEILEAAQEIGADLIALPAHEKGRIERFFVGSTTEKLARISDRPVLVFPPSWLPAV
jgi:nucleotide-binding universal stress UspA family protein